MLSNETTSLVCVTACLLQAPWDDAQGTHYMCWLIYTVYNPIGGSGAIQSHQLPSVFTSRPMISAADFIKNRLTADKHTWLQAFLLAAMKFHCYVKELPLRAQADSQLAWLVIQRGIEYLSNLVKTRVQGACRRCHLHTCLCMLVNNFVCNSDCFVLPGHCPYKDNGRFAAWCVVSGSRPRFFPIPGLCLLLTGIRTRCLLPRPETWAHQNLHLKMLH